MTDPIPRIKDQACGQRFRTIASSCFLLRYTFRASSHLFVNGHYLILSISMMTSSNGNIFRVTGHLCAEFTGLRWIPRTKASDAELWCFLWSVPDKRLSKQSWGWWFETQSGSLWRHSNARGSLHCHVWYCKIALVAAMPQGKMWVATLKPKRHWLHFETNFLQWKCLNFD